MPIRRRRTGFGLPKAAILVAAMAAVHLLGAWQAAHDSASAQDAAPQVVPASASQEHGAVETGSLI
ncbi:hypothetical protein [Salipiger mucosus]|uniref:Uncharacterized protein n=1 Tax=Salipiger mucosus DSM 16094 TaxID=1123237 RepID=S9S2J1_9RHOB|nr:hypothetical protein [Salipiger mucosus]EPX80414.1 hypothetical protein Salmuc_03730 [Salipiger mucosus DSM 16094]